MRFFLLRFTMAPCSRCCPKNGWNLRVETSKLSDCREILCEAAHNLHAKLFKLTSQEPRPEGRIQHLRKDGKSSFSLPPLGAVQNCFFLGQRKATLAPFKWEANWVA